MTNHLGKSPHTLSSAQVFVRDNFTWLAYIILGYLTYMQAALGPLASLLQKPFHLNDIEISLPTGAFATGIILIGFSGETLLRTWKQSTERWIWLGGCGMALGALLLIISLNIAMIILSAFVIGVFATLLQFILQAELAEHHQEKRTVALTEANVITSAGAVLAPLCIGGLQSAGAGWRVAIFCAPLIFFLALYRFRLAAPAKQDNRTPAQTVQSTGFPLIFWLYWVVLVCCVAIEWSVIVWSAIMLSNTGIASPLATMLVSLFFVAEMSGRFLGSRLARRSSGISLLMSALVLTLCGFLLFWLCPQPAGKIAGLLLTGLGIANLYPLTLAIALGTVPQRIGAASARLSLGTGLAMLAAPLLLGWLASMLGIQHAYGFMPVLLLIAVILTQWANRLGLAGQRSKPC